MKHFIDEILRYRYVSVTERGNKLLDMVNRKRDRVKLKKYKFRLQPTGKAFYGSKAIAIYSCHEMSLDDEFLVGYLEKKTAQKLNAKITNWNNLIVNMKPMADGLYPYSHHGEFPLQIFSTEDKPKKTKSKNTINWDGKRKYLGKLTAIYVTQAGSLLGKHLDFPEGRRELLKYEFHLARTDKNTYEPKAVGLEAKNPDGWVLLGYINAKDSGIIAEYLDQGYIISLSNLEKGLSGATRNLYIDAFLEADQPVSYNKTQHRKYNRDGVDINTSHTYKFELKLVLWLIATFILIVLIASLI